MGRMTKHPTRLERGASDPQWPSLPRQMTFPFDDIPKRRIICNRCNQERWVTLPCANCGCPEFRIREAKR